MIVQRYRKTEKGLKAVSLRMGYRLYQVQQLIKKTHVSASHGAQSKCFNINQT